MVRLLDRLAVVVHSADSNKEYVPCFASHRACVCTLLQYVDTTTMSNKLFPHFRAYRHMVPQFTIKILNLAPVRCERGGDTYIQYVILFSSVESLE